MKGSWRSTTISEACLIRPPKREAKRKLAGHELVSFVPMNTLGVHQKDFDTNETRPLDEVYGGYTYFADGDVLLAKITPCFQNGKLGIARRLANGIGFGSSEYFVLRCREQLDPEFLFYFLSQERFTTAGVSQMSGAVGHQRVPLEFIETYPLLIPRLPEQRRIVAILNEAFAAIATATANTEESLANAREMFETYRDQTLDHRDCRWPLVSLEDVCQRFEYGTSAKSRTTGRVPVLRMGNIQDEEIDWSDLVYSSDPDEIQRYSLRPNDVLFNRTNSPEHVGKTAIVRGKREAIFAGYLIRIHRNPRRLDSGYLNHFLNSRMARGYGKTVMSGSVNQANISASKLKKYPIPLPPVGTQKIIAATLDRVKAQTSEAASLYSQKLTLLTELRQSILHKAFTGELTADLKTADVALPKGEV